MAKELPKYIANCDSKYMQITGFIGPHGACVERGTEVTTHPDFPPRASMWPINKAAEAAFEKRRAEVKKETEKQCAIDGLTKEQTELVVKAAIKKVGPKPLQVFEAQKKKKKRLAPGMFAVSGTPEMERSEPSLENDDEVETIGPSTPAAQQRAADTNG